MGSELEPVISFGIQYVISRYGVDPAVRRIEQRLKRLPAIVEAKLRGRPYVTDDRVTLKAIEEAAVADALIVADYLGGVLAATSAVDGDRGTAVVAQIGRLSASQLRLHYVIYRALWELEGRQSDLLQLRTSDPLAGARELFLPQAELLAAIREGDIDDQRTCEALLQDLAVLAREDLIARYGAATFGGSSPGYTLGSANDLERGSERIFPGPGLTARPTPSGITLLLWGCGFDDHDPVALRLIPGDCVEQLSEGVPPVSGAELVPQLPKRLQEPS